MRFEWFGSASVKNAGGRFSRSARALAALFLLAMPASAAGSAGEAGSSAVPWMEALRAMALPIGARLVESPDGRSAEAAERSLREAGYDVAVSIPPRVHVVRATRRAGPLPAGFILRAEGTAASARALAGPLAGPGADSAPPARRAAHRRVARGWRRLRGGGPVRRAQRRAAAASRRPRSRLG